MNEQKTVEKTVEIPAENYHKSEATVVIPKPEKIEEKNIIYHISK